MQSINVELAEAIRLQYIPQCRATTLAGAQCRKRAESNNGLCAVHDPARKCNGTITRYTRLGNRVDSWCNRICPPDDVLCGPCRIRLEARRG